MGRIDPVWFDGDYFRKLLKKRKITQKRMATMLNTNNRSVFNYIHEKQEPSLLRLRRIATILNCNVEELIKK